MAFSGVSFEERIRKILQLHERLRYGTVSKIQNDGLVVQRPKLYNPKFPVLGLLVLVVAGVFFKAYIYAGLGAAEYDQRIEKLAEGSIFERLGAWIMQADFVTVALSHLLKLIGA